MADHPVELPVDPVEAQLVRLYRRAEAQITALLRGADARGALGTARYYTAQRRAVQAVLDRLARQSVPVAAALPPSAYVLGVSAVERTIDPSAAFTGVHTAAMDVVAANLVGRLSYARDRIGREAEDALRKLGLQSAGIAISTGISPRQQIRELTRDLARTTHPQIVRDGTTAFVDRAGRRWKLGNYAAMVARTTTREAVTAGMVNRLREAGFDLVTISSHRGSCPICLPFQGKTYSLSGADPEYPMAEDLPPFHPNCRHVLLPATVTFERVEKALGLGPLASVEREVEEQTPSWDLPSRA